MKCAPCTPKSSENALQGDLCTPFGVLRVTNDAQSGTFGSHCGDNDVTLDDPEPRCGHLGGIKSFLPVPGGSFGEHGLSHRTPNATKTYKKLMFWGDRRNDFKSGM